MSSPNTTLNIIFATKRGSAPRHDPATCVWRRVEWYDVALKPSTPIEVGQKVRIISTREAKDAYGEESRDATVYTASDTGVEGWVTRIRTMEKNTVEFVVRNEVEWMTTEIVYLTAELKQDEMVRLSLLQRAIHAITMWWTPTTRWVRTEENARVRGDETNMNL
ncbi:hypothetical protein C2E23DRAFT_731961 [Lenzites betulinus]|nr:hypothetical protein C2E23DRAFT_731961 [Lenzites betulinus]